MTDRSASEGRFTDIKAHLVGLVSRYTAEPPTVCRARAMGALNRLRGRNLEVLETGVEKIDMGTLRRLRRALLPDAGTPQQRALEAAILAAIPDATGPSGRIRANPILRATPGQHGLGLHIQPEALIPLLFVILPWMVDGELRGCPGLRVTPVRRSLIMHLADPPGGAVMIHGTPLGAFPGICRDLADLAGNEDAIRLWAPGYGHGESLTAAEQAARERFSGRTQLDRVSSALLRRPGAWPAAVWTREGMNHELVTSDPGGVAHALSDRLCGIPFCVQRATDRVVVTTKPIGTIKKKRGGDHGSDKGE